ncbi:uncharacterized protein A4U43_C08F2550 [Asparagus officinalis]|uniref:uncharacterized protein LOC109820248 n=1 Tax=Asparagus officinalis TaxID=4686 RepID=UPI00098E64BD|nr:uncharacterized protein LOC109820248 [Asparagus officinalis]ONK59058.1 uncharacterized protein A4U43_C08F2550 [Asparagus officinalis]
MEKQELDYVLVPLGIGLMVAYHFWLLFRVISQPTKTVIGINAINRRLWVRTMMKDFKNAVLAVQTFRNNIMVSTLMASTAITLSSLIAVLMTNGSLIHDSQTLFIGNKSDLNNSIKFFSILVCFLLAFLMNVQSIRYYSHANILINVPIAKNRAVAVNYVARALNRGGYFWSIGLRAYYFSFPLFLWVFGPIPMFVCCVVMVFVLYFLDVNTDGGGGEDQVWMDPDDDEGEC